MKQKLLEIWESELIDHGIQIAIIIVLLASSFKVMNARATLDDGCTEYWEKYNPEVNLSNNTLVNKTEASNLKHRGIRSWKEDPGIKGFDYS